MTAAVTELTIDARGAEQGSATYIKAMAAAQRAVDRLIDSHVKAQDAQERQTTVLAGGAASIGRVAAAWDRLRASVDPAAQVQIRAQREMERAAATTDNAIKRGLATRVEADAVMTRLSEKHVRNLQRVRRETAELAAEQARQAQASINSTLGVRADFGGGSRGADVAAYGAELDQLRGRFNPLFGAIHQYKTMLAEIRRAHAVGAISTDEMTQAIKRERTAALESIAALKGRRAAMGGGAGGFQAANLAYQLQDVGITASMGMSPLMIGLQQGSQASMSFAGMSAGQAVKTLGAGIASLITPVSLATVGLTAAAAAAIQLFTNSEDAAERAEKAIESYSKVVGDLEKRFDAAADAAKRIAEQGLSRPELQAGLQLTSEELRVAFQDEMALMRQRTQAINEELFGAVGQFADRFSEGEEALARLTTRMTRGQVTVAEFRQELAEVILDKTAEENTRKLAKELFEASLQARVLQDKILGIGKASETLDKPVDVQAIIRGEALADQLAIRDANAGLAVDRMQLRARSPQQRASAARARAALSAPGDESPLVRQNRIEIAGVLELERAYHELNEARTARERSLDQTIASQRLELDLIGKTGAEAEALRMQFELTSQLREEAAKSGIVADEKELELIRQKSSEMRTLADLQARRSMQNDLMFERDQLFRTGDDATIAQMQRGAGLEVDLTSPEAALARYNLHMERSIELTHEFGATFLGELRNGASAIDALTNSVARLGDRLLDMALDNAIQMLFGSFFGVGPSSSFSLFPSAKGNVFQSGSLVPFAKGGIVDRPTVFPMARGAGLMGEAGPEAIMPLRRGSGGRLGVEVAGGNRVQQVVLYVMAEEGDMFKPTVRAEAEGVSLQVVRGAAPGISSRSVQQAREDHFRSGGWAIG